MANELTESLTTFNAGGRRCRRVRKILPVAAAIISFICGCGVTESNAPPPPPPPPSITVNVLPVSTSVLLGATQQFTATVSNTIDTSVAWTVNGISGGNSTVGTLSSSGLYTAPQTTPQPGTVIVRATSAADATASGSASVTVTNSLAVNIAPATANVELGATQPFVANLTNGGSQNPAVTWSLAGSGCAGAACGTVDANGDYVAPSILPVPPGIVLTARSVADQSKAGAAAITVTSNFMLSISGPDSVNAGATANYTAVLTPPPNSNPSTTVSWTLTGTGCAGAACGSISTSGATAVYQAPGLAPFPNTVTLAVTSAADATKTSTLNIAINPQITIAVSPQTSVLSLGGTQSFTAQVAGSTNTNVIWDVNGVVGGNASIGTLTNGPGQNTTTYKAPAILPPTETINVTATSVASSNFSGKASVTVAGLSLSPSVSTLAVNHRQLIIVELAGTVTPDATFKVNGIPGGNSSVGMICQDESDPCEITDTETCEQFGPGPAVCAVDYLSPAAAPSPNPVTLTVTSVSNPSLNASALITTISHVVITVSPPSASVSPGSATAFSAAVVGTTNQSVTWNLSGAPCDQNASACGAITQDGIYTAPIATPSPDSVGIVVTSSEDSSRIGTASITVVNGASISTLLPASAYAGSAGSFTLRVQGGNFAPSDPGPGSQVVIGGTPRTTFCATIGDCTTVLTAADLAAVGNLGVKVRNPDSTFSNQVSFVVVLDTPVRDAISLTPGNPTVTGKNILVIEPSTAGSSAPQSNVTLAIAAIGSVSAADNSCALGAGSFVVSRPASGTAIVNICAFSISGLDPSFTYVVTGPADPDITVIGKQPLGLGIVQLTLSIPSTAQTGPRSLFVMNANKDKAVATGALEVK